jgi:phosphatidylglycerol---prolipoprotein diacylglyceryl transferase
MMPGAKNKKRSQTSRRSGAAAQAQRPAEGIPAGLARPPSASAAGDLAPRPGGGVPADLTRRAGDRMLAGLARQPGDATAPGTISPPAGAGARGKPGGGSTAEVAEKPAAGDDDQDVPRWAAKALEQLLTVTYWLDPGEDGAPFGATIRFTGYRTDVTGASQPGDTFTREETVDGIVPGSGPVAVTTEVRGINPGEWTVQAGLVTPAEPAPAAAGRVPWPRLVTVPAAGSSTLRTTTIMLSKVPGIIRYAYACLVALGVLSGLAIMGALLSSAHYPLLRPMLFSVAAVVAGVIGGKAWYAAVHRGRKWDGWCIQGFVGGAVVVVAVVAIVGPGLPAGAFLAAATPALLIGMGIGRHACFWAGCCTGRPTASRWGIWSSDRHLGCRRMPVQLYEAWTALAVGAGSLLAVLLVGLHRSGPVAVAGLAAYTLIRQLILGLRAEPRQWRHGRLLTGTLAALALVAGIALFAAGA